MLVGRSAHSKVACVSSALYVYTFVGKKSCLKVENNEMRLGLKENVLIFSFLLGKELRCLENTLLPIRRGKSIF